jgi:hypothetical protein
MNSLFNIIGPTKVLICFGSVDPNNLETTSIPSEDMPAFLNLVAEGLKSGGIRPNNRAGPRLIKRLVASSCATISTANGNGIHLFYLSR